MEAKDVAPETETVGSLHIVPFAHPQGCCGYLLADSSSQEALALDVHLDFVYDMAARVEAEGWKLRFVVDSHTHADHPSGAGAMAERFGCERMAHQSAGHAGVTVPLEDGDHIDLGDSRLTACHTPGHTPDHVALVADGVVFSGDSLFIGSVARTDFIGGDAGQLFDSIQRLLADLPADALLFPGHDYQGRSKSTLGDEKASNPWLQVGDRDEFARQLTANPPPIPANMDALLRLNREGVAIAPTMTAADAAQIVAAGGAGSIIDVRTGGEFDAEHIPGVRLVPLDQLERRADEVRALAAPRLLLCRSGGRAASAKSALEKLHVAGLSVVEGGLTAYAGTGGEIIKGAARMSIERQVRIGAGGLVLLGVLLGVFLHPACLAISGFVGAGLVFAGVTDWCGMGIVLGKMPWNQSKADHGSADGGSCAANLPGACAAAPPPAEDGQPD